jgi:hypothetical protein
LVFFSWGGGVAIQYIYMMQGDRGEGGWVDIEKKPCLIDRFCRGSRSRETFNILRLPSSKPTNKYWQSTRKPRSFSKGKPGMSIVFCMFTQGYNFKPQGFVCSAAYPLISWILI